jgi:3-oxoacyl-[acyl-carrier protein] reductase
MSAGVAMVTGGSRGVGRTIAQALSAMGYAVHICARTESELRATAQDIGGVRAARVDVSDAAALKGWAEAVLAEAGGVDVLVNNVGVMAAVGPLWTVDLEEWEAVCRLNLFSTARLCHHVIPAMIQRRQGCIINLAGGGSAYPRAKFSAYACSKAAVLRLSDTLAEELREYGIRVNAVAPGLQRSEIWRHAAQAGETPPTTGWAEPEPLMRLIRYLVSSPHVTGKFLHIDDDYERLDDEILASELYTLRRMSPSGRSVIPGRAS